MNIAPKISEKDVEGINKILSVLKKSPYVIDDKACRLLDCGNEELERYKDIMLYYGGARLNDYKYLMVNDDTTRYLATNKYQFIFEAQEEKAKKESLIDEQLRLDVDKLKKDKWVSLVSLLIGIIALLISILTYFFR